MEHLKMTIGTAADVAIKTTTNESSRRFLFYLSLSSHLFLRNKKDDLCFTNDFFSSFKV